MAGGGLWREGRVVLTRSRTYHLTRTCALQPGTGFCARLSFAEEKGGEEPVGLNGLSGAHTECTAAADAAPFPPGELLEGRAPGLTDAQPPLCSPVSQPALCSPSSHHSLSVVTLRSDSVTPLLKSRPTLPAALGMKCPLVDWHSRPLPGLGLAFPP